MRNLEDFHAPLDGEIALCEVNGRVFSRSFEFTNVNAFTNTVENHPQIRITRDSLHLSSASDEEKDLFLPVDVPFVKQIVQIYYEHGLTQVFQTVSSSARHPVLSKIGFVALKLMSYAEKLQSVFNRAAKESSIKLISEFSQTRGWINNPIRCFSWHPCTTKLAVACLDDVVRIYSTDSSFTTLLKCKQQKNVTCLAWRPMTISDIAVACENCIIVWNIDPSSVVQRPSISNATVIYRIEHKSVISVAWGPRGDVLASAAICDPTVLVWDVELDQVSRLKRPGYSGNVLLKWSATGDKLFCASDNLVFRVWDCQNWHVERWTVQTGKVQSACWSSSGSFLLFATDQEPMIYGLTFAKSDIIFLSKADNTPNLAVPLFDVTRIDLDGVMVGGIIQTMDMDPKENYLAVLFQHSNCIAVFNVIKQPVLRLTASSLVSGLPEEKPSFLEFQKNFAHGSCLTISWSSGRIQHYPIVYEDESLPVNGNLSIYNSTVGSSSLHSSLFV